MSQKKNTKQVKKVVQKKGKRKVDKASLIILIGIIVFAIPCIIVGYELVSAQLSTHKPVLGNRFKDDLDPEITSSDIKTLQSSLKGINGVQDVDIQLKTATLRIYLDIEDSSDSETASSIASSAFDTVNNQLSMDTYFTQHDDMKMYDLEIHVYNNLDYADTDAYAYVILNKSSSMENYNVQTVSQALDEELAQQLRDAVEEKNNPSASSDSGDITVSNEEEAPSDSSENPSDSTDTSSEESTSEN